MFKCAKVEIKIRSVWPNDGPIRVAPKKKKKKVSFRNLLEYRFIEAMSGHLSGNPVGLKMLHNQWK